MKMQVKDILSSSGLIILANVNTLSRKRSFNSA